MAVWWLTEDLLRLAGVSRHVAAMAGDFSLYSLPRALPFCWYYCFKMYLSSQRIVNVDLVSS
jgi:hypothetical protein